MVLFTVQCGTIGVPSEYNVVEWMIYSKPMVSSFLELKKTSNFRRQGETTYVKCMCTLVLIVRFRSLFFAD